jgi:hypothetical protein
LAEIPLFSAVRDWMPSDPTKISPEEFLPSDTLCTPHASRFPHNRSLNKNPPTHPPRTHSKMPIEFVPLHKTFAAEVRGVDFSKPIPKDVADEIIRGADKYGVLVFRKTGMTDEQHVQFSKHFGDLDDISGYIPPGVSMSRRTRFLELFDASNLDAAGVPLPEHEKRYQYNKVHYPYTTVLISG